jgi:hypothetical protein
MIRGLLLLSFCLSLAAFAQEGKTKEEIEREKAFQAQAAKEALDTIKTFGWKHAVATGLNLSQVSFRDWAGGGQDALAYMLWLKGSSTQDLEQTEWGNSYKFGFGQTRLGDRGTRKTDDEIYVQSLLIYKLGTHVNPYASATLRTQFSKGYIYTDTSEIPNSKFFDPANMTQSAGVAYQPTTELTTRFGLGVREVITSEFTFYADDPTTPEIEKVRVQGGFESITDGQFVLAENVSYSAKLELFAAFKSLDKVLVRFVNTLTAKVNKYVNVNLNVQLINDVSVSPLTQVKEALALGISYILL